MPLNSRATQGTCDGRPAYAAEHRGIGARRVHRRLHARRPARQRRHGRRPPRPRRLRTPGRGQGRPRAVRAGRGVPGPLPPGGRGGPPGERGVHRPGRGRRSRRRTPVDGHPVRAGPHAGGHRRQGRRPGRCRVAHAGAGPGRGAAGHPPGGRGAPGPETEQRPDGRGRPARHRLRHLARRRQPGPHRDRTADRHPALHVPGAVRLAPGRHRRLGRVLAGFAAGVRGHGQTVLSRARART